MMAVFRCFSVLPGRKDKKKGSDYEGSLKKDFNTKLAKLQARVSSQTCDSVPPYGIQINSRSNVRVMNHESPVKAEVEEAYELEVKNDRHSRKSVDGIRSGHVSDPGIGRTDFLASPKLKRSCSNFEKRDVIREVSLHLPPTKSHSFEDFHELSANTMVNLESPKSVMSHCSADRVMLKRHSSSQVLPSRSKKLWWKLFLWSHRNIHSIGRNADNQKLSRFQIQNEKSGLWSQNQWFAFSTSFDRVDAWVKDLEIQEPLPEDEFDDDNGRSIVFPPSPSARRSNRRSISQLFTHTDANISKEVLNANSVVQSLNPTSTIAHISGIGIKSIPAISHLSNLRAVNLSGNFIVHISPGFLPKSIQTLNLSRNKISALDGLRELPRLRALDISYNRISRIGQGLSSCTHIKELCLAGNKISDVEGLHRLLKLTVLDLSFNKITTTKALGQLVANYNSLQALNLLGNPIQSNISDDQLRKAVCGLLPKIVYLNKQPIKAQRARKRLADSVAKAALGNSKMSSKRKSLRRKVSLGGSSSTRGHRSNASFAPKSRNRTKRDPVGII